MLQIRKYFFQIRIRGAAILTSGSGSRRPAGPESYLDIFVPNEKIYVIIAHHNINLSFSRVNIGLLDPDSSNRTQSDKICYT